MPANRMSKRDGVGLRAADIQPDLHRPTSLWEAAASTTRISP